MKKPILAMIIVCIYMALTLQMAMAETIGYIDVQKVFSSYKETKLAQARLAKKEAAYKKEFDKYQKKIEAAKKAKKPKKEIDALIERYEKKLEPIKKELVQLNNVLTSKLQNNIVKAVKVVAKELGVDIVLDKQALIVGGMDLSGMVINKLNKK